jgi:bacillithiol biosynthesis cysteine-adding enzyme BshC
MSSDCIALSAIPHTTRLFRSYAEGGSALPGELRDFYAAGPQSRAWEKEPLAKKHADPAAVATLLEEQNRRWGASEATLANIDRLRKGARAVVTGQQVTLFGGPLYSLLKAATAVRLAAEASEHGTPHVPIFWLATEDHDFPEVNTASFPERNGVTTLHLSDAPEGARPVGGWVPGAGTKNEGLGAALEQAATLLGDSWALDLLRESYAAGASLAEAFARLYLKLFADYGLVVVDASSRAWHGLAAPVLASAIETAEELHDALVTRSAELEAGGFHAQVLVAEHSSLLFLLDKDGHRVALRRIEGGTFVASGEQWTEATLLELLREAPERLSANALLRPVVQDYLLPTAAYVGGPAEIAYFAQSQVLYERLLGRTTPILPRLSATLVERPVARLLERYELSVPDVWRSAEELALRLGARAMPVERKQKLAAAGNTLDKELAALLEHAQAVDAGLGHSAEIAANKMRYQMNRLRRLMARYSLERDEALEKHADMLTTHLYPNGGLQERTLAALYFVAKEGPGLMGRLVEEASDRCPGHRVITL